MFNSFRSLRLEFKKPVSKLLIGGVAFGTVFLSGLVPTPQHQASGGTITLSFGNAAYAQQAITAEELQNYARSVLAIEPIRQTAYDEIKRILGTGDVPAIACNRPNSLNTLDRRIRQIAVRYCNRSIQIVESNNLTINRFNVITVAMQGDPNLAGRIRAELIRWQQETP